MRRLFLLILMLCTLCGGALSEEPMAALSPVTMAAVSAFEPVALYCGPTQGFYRHAEQTIDLAQPFVCFGQYDCWSMVAQGVEGDFGPVGFIESGLFDDHGLPELSFDDAFSAMIEEDAPVTDDPLHPENAWDLRLARGTQIVVLAEYGGFLYVQTEIDGQPARVFIPAGAI